VSFAAITLCVASHRVFVVVVYFVIDSVRIHLDTPWYFSLRHRVQIGSGIHPASYPTYTGGGGVSPGIKQPDHEHNHSPPSSVEVKNAWSLTSIPPNAFMALRA
jgi:hypothetical protein